MRVLLFAILLFALIHWWAIVALFPTDMQKAFGLFLVLACFFGAFGYFDD